jgi:Fe-S cluster biogenesis protein NfuA
MPMLTTTAEEVERIVRVVAESIDAVVAADGGPR